MSSYRVGLFEELRLSLACPLLLVGLLGLGLLHEAKSSGSGEIAEAPVTSRQVGAFAESSSPSESSSSDESESGSFDGTHFATETASLATVPSGRLVIPTSRSDDRISPRSQALIETLLYGRVDPPRPPSAADDASAAFIEAKSKATRQRGGVACLHPTRAPPHA